MFAGSDTTAITLRAVIYFLIRSPEKMAKVQAEIDAADHKGKLSNPISYQKGHHHPPYLGAVLKESMRLHPSMGLILEHHVPNPVPLFVADASREEQLWASTPGSCTEICMSSQTLIHLSPSIGLKVQRKS